MEGGPQELEASLYGRFQNSQGYIVEKQNEQQQQNIKEFFACFLLEQTASLEGPN